MPRTKNPARPGRAVRVGRSKGHRRSSSSASRSPRHDTLRSRQQSSTDTSAVDSESYEDEAVASAEQDGPTRGHHVE